MLRLLFPVVLLGVLASAALAQAAFDRSVADIALMQVDAVKTELKLTAAQRAKMNEHAKAFNALGKTVADKLNKNQRPTEAEQKRLETLREQMRTRILNELTPAQLQRLRELTLQDAGLIALASNEVVARLGISNPVATNLRKELQSGMERSAKLMSDAEERLKKEFGNKKPKNKAEEDRLRTEFQTRMEAEMRRVRPQVEAIAKATETRVMNMLTPAQRTAWRNLQGRPFRPA